jgi:phosphohistidine phosphatase
MRRLILLRHAKTEHDAPSGRDIDRRLEDRGKQDAALTGAWIVRHDFKPDLALVSTAVRAQETWAILANALSGTRVDHMPDLYGADPGELLRIIHAKETADPKTLMIVAHNPGLHELALGLIAGGDAEGLRAMNSDLPTSGVIIIDFEIGNWSDVSFRSGTLKRFISPKLIKESSGSQ